jgi:hypothetical protein
MKKQRTAIIILSLITILLADCAKSSFGAQSYYINSISGNDSSDGLSPETAWASLINIGKIEFKPGTKILLASGIIIEGGLELKNVSGTSENPIEISTYESNGNTSWATIDAKGFPNGILIENCSHI